MSDLQTYKHMLERRMAALQARIENAERVLTSEHTKDWEDQAIEREGEEVLETLSQTDASEVERIKAAMKRIEDGTYGECLQCGDDISPERLEILPDATLCRDCARANEDRFDNMPV